MYDSTLHSDQNYELLHQRATAALSLHSDLYPPHSSRVVVLVISTAIALQALGCPDRDAWRIAAREVTKP